MPGRPRDPNVDEAVLAATVELLSTTRYTQLSVAAIARRASVGKPSLYLRWPAGKAAIVADAMAAAMVSAPFPDRGDLRADLETGLRDMIRRLTSSPAGRALPGLLADLQGDPDLAVAFRERYFEPRWRSIRAAVDRAKARGELDPGVDEERVIDLLTGPIYYRILVRDAPPIPSDATHLVEAVLAAAHAGALQATRPE